MTTETQEYKRPFNKSLYNEFDMDSKKATINLMQNRGYEMMGDINEEHYKEYDLKFHHKEKNITLAIENEFRGSFEEIKNKYPSVHIPIRKKNSQCDYYFVWGMNYTEVGIIKMTDIAKFSETPVDVLCKTANRKYNSPEYIEPFIDVPKEFVQFFKINENNNWKKQTL